MMPSMINKTNRIFDTLAVREPIHKGWSDDRKYRAETADGSVYLLRISAAERSENRKRLFELQMQASKKRIPMCFPIECGVCEEGFYFLQSWVNGEDAESVIPCLPERDQYRMGRRAGEILNRIHQIPAPSELPSWEKRFGEKIDRKIQRYRACPIQIDGAERILQYLAENRDLLKGRPQSFQHGDYHIGNMMIEKGKLVIIDFDRYDFGDPWEEFNRIVWCAQSAPPFAAGMVDGYFGDRVPQLFWQLLALYIGSNTISSVSWAISYGEEETKTMLAQAQDVLEWYDGYHCVIPKWYAESKKRM